jgi:hypothetical protein
MKHTRSTLAIVGLSGLLAGNACSNDRAEKAPVALGSPSALQLGSTLVDCGPGQRPLLEQAEGLTRVQCVAGPTAPYSDNGALQPIPVNVQLPASVRAPAPLPPAPPEVRPAARSATRTASARGRTWKKSAVLIGGSTAAGAGVGAILDGGSGAKKGAVVGLVGGVVYDNATRDR